MGITETDFLFTYNILNAIGRCFPTGLLGALVHQGISSNSLNMFRLQEEEELTELQADRSLKLKFNEVSLGMFWFSMKAEFPFVVVKVLSILLQFSTSYLCEQAFAYLTNMKSKSRNRRLSVEEELRVCLSEIRVK